MMSSLGQKAPRVADWVSETFLLPIEQGDRPASPGDNLYHGMAEARIHGDHQGSLIRPSAYSRAARNPLATLAVAGAAAFGFGAMLWHRRNRREAPADSNS